MGREHEREAPSSLPPDVSPQDVEAIRRADVVRYYRGVIRGVLRGHGVSTDDWEDVEQDVLAKAFAARADYDPGRGTVRQWMCKITHNTLRERWRTLRRKPDRRPSPVDPSTLLDSVSGTGLNPEQQVHARDWIERLDSAVPAPLRETFRLHVEQHTSKEIGARFGLSVHTVKDRIRRVTARLEGSVTRAKEKREDAARVRIGFLPALLCVQASGTASGGDDPALSPACPAGRPRTSRALLGERTTTASGGSALWIATLAVSAALVSGSAGHLSYPPKTGLSLPDTPASVAALGDYPAATAMLVPAAPGAALAEDTGPPKRHAPSAPVAAMAAPFSPSPRGAAPREPRARIAAPEALLQRAWDRLHAGRPAEALALVRQHSREHPGRSVTERAKLTAQAERALAPPPLLLQAHLSK